MTPRGSISSVMSTGLQNFMYNADYDSDEEKEDDEVRNLYILINIRCVIIFLTRNDIVFYRK